MRRSLPLSPFDALLLLMVIIWGSNYSVVKAALREIPPQAFNAARMAVASAVFAAALAWTGLPRLPKRDWIRIAAVGAIGHFVYQLFFISGIARTSASNSSLIIGCSPVAVSIASALAGHERIAPAQWAGILISLAGVYLVVGLGAGFGGASLAGDLLTMGAVVCWAVYTVGSRTLLTRYSPLTVTGLTMLCGTMLLVPASLPAMSRVAWTSVPAWAWVALVLSALLAIDLAYLIWYTSVQRIGNVRTSAYSNFIPLVAMAVAIVALGESLTVLKAAGAAAILGGVAITRTAAKSRAMADPPGEE
ncbi:MAG TPA: EamA family transporter [Vicinamibacterales bacterium]|nr:EamA family transporter [Vicinamibacterales bacterium]HOQ60368.1 EamA family transporter [Vicinamibacterales bacterium]